MTIEHGIGEAKEDQFPTGLRVLAVDDDPTCLLLLENLLRRCQYKVTTTSHAITALKMLRDNKDQFDLVISDVHMPDMDGFKLLEHVGLEMDLPVIMLSANSDPKLVMKGITHGACDYLLKPVRIEELKNIWQHVIRRRKADRKDWKNSESGGNKPDNEAVETNDQKLNKKRKDQNEDDDEDRDDNGHDNDDPTSQKKPRVVWSVDLHRKFVQAVNQLGIDKAVPKKILDMMNVDKLSRENVASHLQKYRLYLKRISTVANQQANMVAALGSTDASYLQMGSMIPSFTGPGQFQNPAFAPHMLGRLNSPAPLGIHGLPSPGGTQLSLVQTGNDYANNRSQIQSIIHPANNGTVLQGMPMPLDLGQMHSNGIQNSKVIVGSLNGRFLAASNKPMALNSQPPRGGQSDQVFGKQSSSVHVIDSGFASHEWSNTVQSTGVQPNSFTTNDHFHQATLHGPCGMRGGNMSTIALQSGINTCNVSDTSTLSIKLHDSQSRVAAVSYANNNSSLGWNDSVNFHVENEGVETLLLPRQGYGFSQPKLPGSYVPDNFGSLEDLVSATVKKEEDKVNLTGEFGYGSYNSVRRHAYEL